MQAVAVEGDVSSLYSRIHEEDIEDAFRMPLADAIIYKEKMPNDGIRRFKFYDERAFVKFVGSLKRVKLPAFKVVIPSGNNKQGANYYIVHGEDNYGEVIVMFRGTRGFGDYQSAFIEVALKKLNVPLKTYTGDYLLDLLRL